MEPRGCGITQHDNKTLAIDVFFNFGWIAHGLSQCWKPHEGLLPHWAVVLLDKCKGSQSVLSRGEVPFGLWKCVHHSTSNFQPNRRNYLSSRASKVYQMNSYRHYGIKESSVSKYLINIIVLRHSPCCKLKACSWTHFDVTDLSKPSKCTHPLLQGSSFSVIIFRGWVLWGCWCCRRRLLRWGVRAREVSIHVQRWKRHVLAIGIKNKDKNAIERQWIVPSMGFFIFFSPKQHFPPRPNIQLTSDRSTVHNPTRQ